MKLKLNYNDVFSPYSNPYSHTYNNVQENFTMEIFNQSGPIVNAKFYLTNPIAGKPSKPQNLKVQKSANNHPYLTWDANQEPDVLSGGHYKIYKFLTENGWYYYAQTANTYFEDINENYCTLPPKYCTDPGFRSIRYRVTAVDNTSKESVPSDSVVTTTISALQDKINITTNNKIPDEYLLNQNYPNPFNPTTRIDFSLKENGIISLKVYDLLGRDVATLLNEQKPAGTYSVEFNATNLPSGIYFYTLTSGKFMATKKLILLK